MEESGKEFKGLTRREFLYLSGAGVAGMTLTGVPGLSYGQKREVWRKDSDGDLFLPPVAWIAIKTKTMRITSGIP